MDSEIWAEASQVRFLRSVLGQTRGLHEAVQEQEVPQDQLVPEEPEVTCTKLTPGRLQWQAGRSDIGRTKKRWKE
jgi:hypothetical protein